MHNTGVVVGLSVFKKLKTIRVWVKGVVLKPDPEMIVLSKCVSFFNFDQLFVNFDLVLSIFYLLWLC
jgi:hypothetical protein